MVEIDLTDIQGLINNFVLAIKDKINRNGTNASGKLSKSIKGIVKKNGKWIEISVSLEDYWKYIEYGTRPHFPPINAIKQWIKVKPILPRPLPNGKLPTTDQLAFLIGRKISKVGTKPQPFLQKTISEFNLIDKIYDLLSEEIEQQINKQIQYDLE